MSLYNTIWIWWITQHRLLINLQQITHSVKIYVYELFSFMTENRFQRSEYRDPHHMISSTTLLSVLFYSSLAIEYLIKWSTICKIMVPSLRNFKSKYERSLKFSDMWRIVCSSSISIKKITVLCYLSHFSVYFDHTDCSTFTPELSYQHWHTYSHTLCNFVVEKCVLCGEEKHTLSWTNNIKKNYYLSQRDESCFHRRLHHPSQTWCAFELFHTYCQESRLEISKEISISTMYTSILYTTFQIFKGILFFLSHPALFPNTNILSS